MERIKRVQRKKKTGGQTWRLLLIAAPGILYLLINNYIPMLGVFLAFKDFNYMKGVFGSDWCGFKNFEFLFKTKDAFIMTRNTLVYNAVFIVIGTPSSFKPPCCCPTSCRGLLLASWAMPF